MDGDEDGESTSCFIVAQNEWEKGVKYVFSVQVAKSSGGSSEMASNTIVIENPSFSWRLVDLWLIHHSSHLRQKGSYLQNDHPSGSLTSFNILFGLFIFFCVTFTFTTFVRISTIVCLFNAVNVSIERLRRNRNDGYLTWLCMSNYYTISKRTSEYTNWSSDIVQRNSNFVN